MSLSSLSKLQRLSRRAPTAGPPPVKGERSEGEALALDKGVQWRSTAEGRSGSAPASSSRLRPHYLVFPGRRPYQIVGPWTSATAPSAPATTATAPTTSTTTSTSNRTSQPEETAPSPQTGGCGVLHIRVLKCGKTRVEAPVSVSALTVHPPGLTSLSTKANAPPDQHIRSSPSSAGTPAPTPGRRTGTEKARVPGRTPGTAPPSPGAVWPRR